MNGQNIAPERPEVQFAATEELYQMIERGYVSIQDGQLHLRRLARSDEGLPLVLLHASPASSRSLEALMGEFGERRPLYAFDTPGNGQSCRALIPSPSIRDLAAMLAGGCNGLGLSRMAIFGTHTGAHIAIEMALAEPDRVKALILDGVLLTDAETNAELLQCYAPAKLPDDSGGQFHWGWHYIRDQMIFYPHYRKSDAHRRLGGTFDAKILHELTLDLLNSLDTYHLAYHAVFRHGVRSALAQLNLPILILVDDGPLSTTAAELIDLVPNPKVAQQCNSDAAKAQAIVEFLEGIEHG